ncbi:POGLUT1 [Symbiodinium sp. KB8]|nr:POGLUT1 [Symbiodinium sp. KB8]
MWVWVISLLPAAAEWPARCRVFNPDFFEQAERDFLPFHGLTPWDSQRAKNLCRSSGQACFVVQVRNGQVFISEEQPGFQSRSRLTMAMLHRVSTKFGPLPDAEFVVDTSDGYAEIAAPIFVISKFPGSAGGILYPDFSSYAWPESECPSEAPGSHVWSQVLAKMAEVPSWSEKTDSLFWRGAATSTYRRQIVPFLASLEKSNVSMMEWVIGPEGQRQVVSSGSDSCIPIHEWCQHKFLANLPGNTMALALKYRLFCGSVVLSSPFLYHEWYYSQLKESEHFMAFDLRWSGADEVLKELRGPSKALAEAVSMNARRWAQDHLTDDGFDCYWLRLIHLASRHFPHPQHTLHVIPLESVMLGMRPVQSASVDVLIVIPSRAADYQLMDHARSTWLRSGHKDGVSHRHFFVIASADPDFELLQIGGVSPHGEDDVLVVECKHGYTQLLQKMVAAYRTLLERYTVKFFIRADVDSMLPLQFLLPLLDHAAAGRCLVLLSDSSNCGHIRPRWQMPAIGHLQCQVECAMDRGCHYFHVSPDGDCATFSQCVLEMASGKVFQYRMRGLLGEHAQRPLESPRRPFVLGTILHGNKVLTNDTHNPQWNNLLYRHDLGLGVYPPYPEASGYAMSSDIAAFLASVGTGALSDLSWNAWAIEDSAMGTILAGLKFDMLQLPAEIREHIRDIAVVVRCPAQSMTNDSCEVILDECHIIADSIASVYENVGIYKRPLQARLNTLHLTEDGYRWAEGQLGMVPVHRRAALKFLKSLVKMLLGESALWDESIEHDEIFKDVPDMGDPCSVPQEPISEAESLLQTSRDRNERRNAWAARIARYFAYCVDGGIMGERFTFPLLIQALGRVSSADVDRQMKEVIDFVLHVNKRDGWKSNLFLEEKPVSLIAMTKESEAFAEYSFNDIIMRHLVSEGYVESELKKRPPGAGLDYADLLAQLLTDESVGLGLRTMVCRHVLDMLGGTNDREDTKFEKTVKQLVPALVKVMVGSNHILMSYATASLVNLSCGRQNMKQLLVSHGVISMCVKQLKTKHDELTLYTLFLLVNLTKTPHHRYIVVREGGVPLLVDILTSSYQNLRKQRILAEVASVLGQLCNDPETRLWLNMSPPCKTRSGHSRLHSRQPDYRKLPGCPVFALGVGLGRAFCLKGLRI